MTELSGQIACQETGLAQEKTADCEECFAALVLRQSRFVFRVAYSVLRNVQDAEDVVQETFLKLYRTGSWRHMKEERAFLGRATWRMAVDRLRQAKHEGLNPASASPRESAEQAVVAADWNSAVHRLIDALPEELRRPLALSSIEELSSREIASILGVPQGTVRHRLMRARQILKRKLATLGDRHGR